MNAELLVIIGLIGWILSLFIMAYIFRSVFNGKIMLQHLRSQTANLKSIRKIIGTLAERQGLSAEEVKSLLEESENEIRSLENETIK